MKKRLPFVLFAGLLAGGSAAHAQPGAPTGYEFMTVVEVEQQGAGARLLFAPAFQGKTELPLERLPGTISADKYLAPYRQNLEIVNRQLEAVTAAGWELVLSSTSAVFSGHEYLFRRPKK